MALAEGQWQLRDLVLGPGTTYQVLNDTNPFACQVRADQGGARAWAHGGWSGVEWQSERVVPIRLLVDVGAHDVAAAIAALHAVAAAFRASHADLSLTFRLGGSEYLLWGRPRMTEPDTSLLGVGKASIRCAFVGLDPLIYSSVEGSSMLGLPQFTGGLVVPVTAPVTVDAVQTAGTADVTNAGTADAGLMLRIDGPVLEPRVTLLHPDGPQTLRFGLELAAGQWLDVDTRARTVLLGGVTSRRGQVSGDWPILPGGTHTIRFGAADYNNDAMLTVSWRSAWW